MFTNRESIKPHHQQKAAADLYGKISRAKEAGLPSLKDFEIAAAQNELLEIPLVKSGKKPASSREELTAMLDEEEAATLPCDFSPDEFYSPAERLWPWWILAVRPGKDRTENQKRAAESFHRLSKRFEREKGPHKLARIARIDRALAILKKRDWQ
ncbi:MAG: hypothetical protein V1763_00730 [Parcubacteria group bacterium]